VEGGDKKVQRSKEKRVIQHNLNEGNETETKKQHSAMTIIQTNTQKRKKEKEKKEKTMDIKQRIQKETLSMHTGV